MEQKNEHFSMWTPFNVKMGEDYQFVPRSRLARVGYVLMRALLMAVAYPMNWLVFGTHVRGRKNLQAVRDRGAVTICNHIHPFDCTMVAVSVGFRRQYFMTIQSNMEIPIARHLVRVLGGVPIPRQMKKMKMMNAQLCEELKKGHMVHVYPEAVLWPYHDGIREFKDGAFRMACDSGAAIVPMVITYRKPRGLYRIWRRDPCMDLNILEPVYPDPKADRRQEIKRLSLECREKMIRFYEEHSDPDCFPEAGKEE